MRHFAVTFGAMLSLCGASVTAEPDVAVPPATTVVKHVPANRLPVLAAAFEENLVTAQSGDRGRLVVVRKKAAESFQALAWLGLKDRDVVQRVNGAVASRESVIVALKAARPGTELKLAVLRDGQERTCVLAIDAGPAAVRSPAETKPQEGAIVVREDAVEKEWEKQSPWLLLVAAAPEMVRDTQGAVVGVRSMTFSDIALARMLGLQSGDIIQSVNGNPVDSEQAIFNLVQKLDGQRNFVVRLVRNCKPLTLNYRVE